MAIQINLQFLIIEFLIFISEFSPILTPLSSKFSINKFEI